MNNSTATIEWVELPSESSTQVQINITPSRAQGSKLSRAAESAVYAYLQALRGVGRKNVSPLEIAEALSLPISTVDGALILLQKKGVRIQRGV